MGFFSKEHSAIAMTPRHMQELLELHCEVECVEGNVVEFSWQEMDLILVYDIAADRMRIMTPIALVEDIEDHQLQKAMEANFHSALDARYAQSDGMLWSLFVHPLSSLSDDLLISAIKQVAMAKLTFGGDYSSGLADFS